MWKSSPKNRFDSESIQAWYLLVIGDESVASEQGEN